MADNGLRPPDSDLRRGELLDSGSGEIGSPYSFHDSFFKLQSCDVQTKSTIIHSRGGNVFYVTSDDVVCGTPGQAQPGVEGV